MLIQVWGCAGSFDYPAWSISAEWMAYLLFPLLLVPTMFRKPIAAWLSALTCVMILATLCALPASLGAHRAGRLLDYSTSAYALPLLRCLPEFTLGILAYRLVDTRFGLWIGSNRWIASGICLLTITLLGVARTDLAVVLLIPLVVVSMASGNAFPDQLLASPPIELLGILSYSIYLTHALLGGLLTSMHSLAQNAGLAHAQTDAAAIAIALTFPIAYAGYRFIELPGRQFLRMLFEGPPAALAATPATAKS
jgi:peptidoglycan/LPS O-acetylase OafA/YrhL